MDHNHILILVGGVLTGIVLLLFKLIVSRQKEITDAQALLSSEMKRYNQAVLDKLELKVSIPACQDYRSGCGRTNEEIIKGIVKDQAALTKIIEEIWETILHHGHEGLPPGKRVVR